MVAFYLWKRGKYYYYRLPGESSFHSTGETNKRKAEGYVHNLLRDGKTSRIKLGAFTESFFRWGECDWIKAQHAAGQSFSRAMAKQRRAHLDNYILPVFGARKLTDINPAEIERWLINLDLGNSTKNSIKYTFSIIFAEAKRNRLVPTNPVNDVRRMSTKNYRRRDIFSLEEIQALFPNDEAKLLEVWGHLKWAVMHYLMLTSGMRCGEVGGILWSHVIWDLDGILILQSIKADGTIGDPKGGQRAAIIPNRTVTLLRRWYEESPFTDPDCYVFFGEDCAKHLNAKTISRKIRSAMEQAGIEIGDRFLGAHSLRHTYNTRMEKLLPEAILRFMIGHKSRQMTERYLHISPREKLSEFLSSKSLIDKAWK